MALRNVPSHILFILRLQFSTRGLAPGTDEIEQQHQSQNKYHYQVDFSSALRIARKYFWRDSRTEKDIIHLMIKYVHAVKEELRQFSRPLRGIGAVHFAFR